MEKKKQEKCRPVIIHRAIYGSFERFFAILIEHTAGKWPFWISPRQVILVTVMPDNNSFAHEVAQIFHSKGYFCDIDDSTDLLKKKIREAQVAQYNYIITIGSKECKERVLNIRTRDDNQQHPDVSIEKALEMMQNDVANFK